MYQYSLTCFFPEEQDEEIRDDAEDSSDGDGEETSDEEEDSEVK